MALPKFPTDQLPLSLLQTQWAQELNPVLALPMLSQNTLTKVALVTGSNTINHMLGRNLQGWFIVRQRSAASIYDTQDSNTNPQRSLVLVTSANVTVDIVVF